MHRNVADRNTGFEPLECNACPSNAMLALRSCNGCRPRLAETTASSRVLMALQHAVQPNGVLGVARGKENAPRRRLHDLSPQTLFLFSYTNPLWQSCGGRPIANRHSARCFVSSTSTIVRPTLLASCAGDADVTCCIL